MHGQLAGHRGWVREGDVPPPTEGGRFLAFFSFTAINFYWFSCVFSSIGTGAQPALEGCHAILMIIQLTPSFIYECCTLINILSWAWRLLISLQFQLEGKKHGSHLNSDWTTELLYCTAVRYVHAPKRDHTPNVRTLNFNICLHKRCLCQGK